MMVEADTRPKVMCSVCEHRHVSAKLVTVVKENGREFSIILCAMCTLMFAGIAETGCDREVNRAN